jgi:hypothetical protein
MAVSAESSKNFNFYVVKLSKTFESSKLIHALMLILYPIYMVAGVIFAAQKYKEHIGKQDSGRRRELFKYKTFIIWY